MLVEGSLLARARLSLVPDGESAQLSMLLESGAGGEPVPLAGAGVCHDGVVEAELLPGPAPAEGVQILGGRVVLANGVAEREPLFGTWEVELSGDPEQAGGFLSARRAELVPHEEDRDGASRGAGGSGAPASGDSGE